MQANILDRSSNDSEATGLCREYIDLIGALPHVTEQTVDGIGGLNVPMHRLRKRIER